MNKKLIIGILVLILISGLVFVGYFSNKVKQEKSPIIAVETKFPSNNPLPIKEQEQINIFQEERYPTTSINTSTLVTSNQKYQLLFNQPFVYLDLDYPLLYVYDPEEEVIKYLDLENETYREIYKITSLEEAYFSLDKSKILLKSNNNWQLLDLNQDSIFNLISLVKNFVFTTKDLILYINDDKFISYLGYFRNGEIVKIRNLGILNPTLEFFNNGILIYEKNSPVFILELLRPDNLKIFLDPKEEYSLLANKKKNLIFVSFKDQIWQSEILDSKKSLIASFSWGTIKEKCSFDEVLVCSLPADLDNFNFENWKNGDLSYDEKIIIFNPQNKKIQEIKLDKQFDIIKPKLTPWGIIFWNRIDSKFYLIKLEETSF